MQKIKVQRCKDLFETLDSDQDGYVSSQKIDISGVSNDIIDIITPLLLKLEQEALVLNYSDFYELLNGFAKNLKTEHMKVLFGPTKQIKSKDVLNTFRPRLNSKSMHNGETIEKSKKNKRVEGMIDEMKIWKDSCKKVRETKDKSDPSK
jgi:hypothetical protein